MSRVQRVGVFNFGTDRVQVLEKTSGLGIGTAFLSIGYYRVLKILIGYFSVTSRIRYFLLVLLRFSQPFRPLDPSACLAQIYIQ